jgi:hypothetical protein
MTDFIGNQLELDRSREFFMDPSSYGQFQLDQDLRRIIGCIEPRDQESDRLRTVVQTAGGAVGEGLDAALALTVVNGELTTIKEGIAADRNVRHTVKLCAHHDCRFIKGLASVLDEIADPSDFTADTVEKWTSFYELGDEVTPGMLKAVKDGAQQVREREYDEADLIEFVGTLYPTPNVATMKGENNARIYVVNHHPNAGLNRHKKHREVGLRVQGYHDSLGATISDQLMSRTAPELRYARLSAHLLRAAAVRTVIGGAHEDTVYLEVQMTEHGAQIAEIVV